MLSLSSHKVDKLRSMTQNRTEKLKDKTMMALKFTSTVPLNTTLL